jgi:hypothetical protein
MSYPRYTFTVWASTASEMEAKAVEEAARFFDGPGTVRLSFDSKAQHFVTGRVAWIETEVTAWREP